MRIESLRFTKGSLLPNGKNSRIRKKFRVILIQWRFLELLRQVTLWSISKSWLRKVRIRTLWASVIRLSTSWWITNSPGHSDLLLKSKRFLITIKSLPIQWISKHFKISSKRELIFMTIIKLSKMTSCKSSKMPNFLIKLELWFINRPLLLKDLLSSFWKDSRISSRITKKSKGLPLVKGKEEEEERIEKMLKNLMLIILLVNCYNLDSSIVGAKGELVWVFWSLFYFVDLLTEKLLG